jgi:hypothetical protein
MSSVTLYEKVNYEGSSKVLSCGNHDALSLFIDFGTGAKSLRVADATVVEITIGPRVYVLVGPTTIPDMDAVLPGDIDLFRVRQIDVVTPAHVIVTSEVNFTGHRATVKNGCHDFDTVQRENQYDDTWFTSIDIPDDTFCLVVQHSGEDNAPNYGFLGPKRLSNISPKVFPSRLHVFAVKTSKELMASEMTTDDENTTSSDDTSSDEFSDTDEHPLLKDRLPGTPAHGVYPSLETDRIIEIKKSKPLSFVYIAIFLLSVVVFISILMYYNYYKSSSASTS